jgi:hypothetical protein
MRKVRLAGGVSVIDTVWSLADRMGISTVIWISLSILGTSVLTVGVFIWERLPWWGSALIALSLIPIVSAALYFVAGFILKVRQFREVEPLDRAALALEAETLSQQINSLVAEHYAAIQAGWNSVAMDRASRDEHTQAVGKLVERYGERFAAKAWRIVNDADKLLNFNRHDLWLVSHGVRSENDITEMAMFLGKTASDLRYGKSPALHDPARL